MSPTRHVGSAFGASMLRFLLKRLLLLIPTFIGVTGDSSQIGNLAGQLGAAYEIPSSPGTANYPVYHTPAVFLLDPHARYHAMFTPPLDAEAISRCFKVVLELQKGKTT